MEISVATLESRVSRAQSSGADQRQPSPTRVENTGSQVIRVSRSRSTRRRCRTAGLRAESGEAI